jgi:polyketide biosynthesis enoyl-CoA hydratase PksI
MEQAIVDLTEIAPGIVELTMQDRVNKNTFTIGLTNELTAAFRTINDNDSYKVVILKGYDNYFASGGSQEALLSIFEGKMQFTDSDLYSLALNCRIPVIAAMHGHAIGGGFVFGLFCDIVVLSRECIYTTNFMKYGFTPGMGATYILPRKLGLALSEEMLLGAWNYKGADLEKRGIPFSVLPKNEVLTHARQMATQLAEKPRHSLITLKDHLVKEIRRELPEVIREEVRMHETTFHQPEVKERILHLFGK